MRRTRAEESLYPEERLGTCSGGGEDVIKLTASRRRSRNVGKRSAAGSRSREGRGHLSERSAHLSRARKPCNRANRCTAIPFARDRLRNVPVNRLLVHRPWKRQASSLASSILMFLRRRPNENGSLMQKTLRSLIQTCRHASPGGADVDLKGCRTCEV